MVRGIITAALLLANGMFWGTPILLAGLVKLVLPGRLRREVVRWSARTFADNWVAWNDRIIDSLLSTEWDVSGIEAPDPAGHYLILSNHLSWADIFVLFRVFHRKTPFIRFFLKYQLIWFPVIGLACWGLDFPFMRRRSAEYLARHPEKRGEDLETTRIACRRYRKLPVSVLNFIEGTRFSEAKHEDQNSPYRHLLRPRIGGIGFVLASMGDLLDATFDVTLAYPGGNATIWDFVSNRIPRIVVRARRIDVPPRFCDEAVTRAGPIRDEFRDWIDALWREKDLLLDEADGRRPAADGGG
jgi:1-acyl-sn-glycerol-3-phosphate acyltransferase